MTDLADTDACSANRVDASVVVSEGSARGEIAPAGDPIGSRWKRRITLASLAVVLIAAAVVLPPLINIGRYQRQITALMTRSLGRPVHMSSVELRLLPSPGFVINDLTVSEDPAFGAEPILSARTVVASVRLLSLWRGKLEVSRVNVDEASLNLVRSAQGRWNLETLMTGQTPGSGQLPRGLAASAQPAERIQLPYLEATNSRVNLKNGVEKSPYSIVDTDLALWQDKPGVWRARLRGQPVRTDIEMSLADTGELRMEASLHSAPQLRAMPFQLQLEWEDAQLGQLSRLLLGSDAGWRGDITADVTVEGTPESARTKARLRATDVRREEFAPETTLDFDANCGFRYQHSLNALHSLTCDTAIGDGQLHLQAEIPGKSGPPEAMLEVQQLPLQAGLDLLRTIRSGFAPGIIARGVFNGSLTYKQTAAPDVTPSRLMHTRRRPDKANPSSIAQPTSPANLQGALILTGAQLRGGELKSLLVLPKMTWTPAMADAASANQNAAPARAVFGPDAISLGTRFTLAFAPPESAQPKSESAPESLTIRLGIGARQYFAAVSGSGGVVRLRDLAYAFGMPHFQAVDSFTSGTTDVDLTAAGPWLADSYAPSNALSDSLSGSLQLHHAQWSPAYLAGTVDLPQGTVVLSATHVQMISDFSYGLAKDSVKDPVKDPIKDSVKGSITVNADLACEGTDCGPTVQLRFGALDAAVLQASLLGIPTEQGLLSPVIHKFNQITSAGPAADKTPWPPMKVELQADSLVLGPTVLRKPAAEIKFAENDILFESWQAQLLGGTASGSGHFDLSGGKPEYFLEGAFKDVSAPALGALIGSPWKGGPIAGSGDVQLSGTTEKELAASASGKLLFQWPHGTALPLGPATAASQRFDSWSGTVAIDGGGLQLGDNTLLVKRHKALLTGKAPFGGPVRLSIAPAVARPAPPAAHSALK